ncbi:transketolase [Rhabdochlamydiaceae symbiont of Dictyostelium giganteum]|uniref:transketolase n=1 Tax=Rhabdochlamydiaceae symbiont of Dictyostelium giganteum TaxID=3342349 RepID=UPI00384D235B
MEKDLKEQLSHIAHTIRALSIDAIQKANSGHPGLPMGCAEFGAYLYGCVLQHHPKNPKFLNRDRFILSAGHGSMWLYSLLHLSGFDLSLEDITQFRQLHSKTPGHPELHMTAGVEATTGPLGQGIGNAAGQALGLKMLAAQFNTEKHAIFNSKVYCLAGDGCMMEGVSAEASSLAGHLRLNNLVLIYDANQICLDGPIEECLSENTKMRYEAYGWEVYETDGHDFDQLESVFTKLKQHQQKPTLIIMRTVIGKGSPHKEGTHKVHGSPLGEEEIILTKQRLGIEEKPFTVADSVRAFFADKLQQGKVLEEEWTKQFLLWKEENPEKSLRLEVMQNKTLPQDLEAMLQSLTLESPMAGRSASQAVIQFLAKKLPQLVGGSADLSCSDLTFMKEFPVITPSSFEGRNIKYGVREFAMGTIGIGLSETQLFLPFVGTFLTFSDYMRNSIRLAALSSSQVIYQFTHDSILLGEDGPTHQPVEHFMTLRAIPQLQVIRPADSHEVKMAWLAALKYKGPTAIILSRQNLPSLEGTKKSYAEGMGRGAYIVKQEKKKADYTLFATGSELSLALNVADALEKKGQDVRVVSMPCWELFKVQDEAYKNSILHAHPGKKVSLEAGISQGWHQWIGEDGITISIDSFGASAPQSALSEEFGFTVDQILHKLRQ